MPEITIKSQNINDAKVFIDGIELNMVESVSLDMKAGTHPVVIIRVIATEGFELSVAECDVTINNIGK